MRCYRLLVGLAMAAAVSWGAYANAQETEPAESEEAREDASENEEVIDEITVVTGPQGQTVFELEQQRLEIIREAVLADKRMRERFEEEEAWRQADPDLRNPDSRIKWGYSPQAEQRMRRDTAFMNDVTMEQYAPASVFRVEF